jgi:hypothetical protein
MRKANKQPRRRLWQPNKNWVSNIAEALALVYYLACRHAASKALLQRHAERVITTDWRKHLSSCAQLEIPLQEGCGMFWRAVWDALPADMHGSDILVTYPGYTCVYITMPLTRQLSGGVYMTINQQQEPKGIPT